MGSTTTGKRRGSSGPCGLVGAGEDEGDTEENSGETVGQGEIRNRGTHTAIEHATSWWG